MLVFINVPFRLGVMSISKPVQVHKPSETDARSRTRRLKQASQQDIWYIQIYERERERETSSKALHSWFIKAAIGKSLDSHIFRQSQPLLCKDRLQRLGNEPKGVLKAQSWGPKKGRIGREPTNTAKISDPNLSQHKRAPGHAAKHRKIDQHDRKLPAFAKQSNASFFYKETGASVPCLTIAFLFCKHRRDCKNRKIGKARGSQKRKYGKNV